MMLTILVCGPKQPSDLIDVYLRPLVDDLKTLWKPGVKEVWDEFKHEHFTLHGMLFTTINDIPAHRNLYGQSKRKGEACPHYLENLLVVAEKLKEICIYGASSFPPQETSIWEHGLSV